MRRQLRAAAAAHAVANSANADNAAPTDAQMCYTCRKKIMKTASLCLCAAFSAQTLFAHSVSSAPERDADSLSIDQVVVTGVRSRTGLRSLPASLTILDRSQLERDMQPSLLPSLTEHVPGLFATARGVMGYGVSGGAAGNISLRGLGGGSGRMMVLVDGRPQYMGLMGHPIADACQSLAAGKVEVLRGPASALYGSGAMGGVVNIITRKMDRDGLRNDLSVSYGSFNSLETAISTGARKGSFSCTSGLSYNRSDGHRKDMGFAQYGGFLRPSADIGRAWSLTADVQLTHFDASNPGEVASPLLDARQRITRGTASLSAANDYGTASGAVSIYCNWGRHWINDGHAADAAPRQYRFISTDRTYGISLYQGVRLFRGNRTTLGADLLRSGGRAANRYVEGERAGQTDVTADKTLTQAALYIDMRQDIGSLLTLSAALRADRRKGFGTRPVPQFGAALHLPHSLELKLSAAKGFRYPTIREMYMFPPQNPDLKPEDLWSCEVSLSMRTGAASWSVTAFRIDGRNMIQTEYVDGSPLNVNTGRIRNAGAEAELSWRVSPSWNLDANYSFLHMKNPVLGAPEHKLCAGAAFSHRRCQLATSAVYVRGLCTSLGDDSAAESFLLWNLNASLRLSRWLSIRLRGENLLAQRYQINAGFPMPRATVMAGLRAQF